MGLFKDPEPEVDRQAETETWTVELEDPTGTEQWTTKAQTSTEHKTQRKGWL